MKTDLGPSLHWYNAIANYSALFAFSADGSIARRFAVLVMVVGLVVGGAMAIRKRRIPGTAGGPTRRLLGITAASLFFLIFTPTKFTHHFGVFAGLGAAVAALVTIAVSQSAMRASRNRTLFVALLLFITGLAFTGPNAYYYISTYGMPWNSLPVRAGIALGSVLLYLAIITVVVAGWQHYRGPGSRPAGPSRSINARVSASSALCVIAAAVVVFELATAGASGIKQSGSYSVASSNIDALGGRICGMADDVLVETDTNAGVLTAADPAIANPLAGTATPAGQAGGGFSPDGVPTDLDADAAEESLGVLAQNVAASPDSLTANASGTGGGTSSTVGVNESTAALPFGLNAATTPVMGSYSTSAQVPATMTSAWYQLPPRSPDQPLVTMAVAGQFNTKDLRLEYSTTASTRDSDHPVGGAITLIDPGPSPSWRNLRIYRSSLPKDAAAIRISAVDNNLASDRFIAVTPPRVPRLSTLQRVVGSSDPVQIDWTSGLAFPCQRPFNHRLGVAELPRWRIMPGADLAAAVSAWQDSYGGGPLGWIEVAMQSTTVPTYLANDIGRDWGSLEKYRTLDAATAAELTVGHRLRSGLWSPGPIRH